MGNHLFLRFGEPYIENQILGYGQVIESVGPDAVTRPEVCTRKEQTVNARRLEICKGTV